MRGLKRRTPDTLWLTVPLLAVIFTVVSAVETPPLEEEKDILDAVGELADKDIKLPADMKDRERFLGTSSTTTYTSVVMVTSTVFYSCLSGTHTVICGKRRKRRNAIEGLLDVPDDGSL